MADYPLILDIRKEPGTPKTVKTRVGDVASCKIIASITKDGAAFPLTGYSVRFECIKPDGTQIQDTGNVSVSGNTVTYTLTKNAAAAPGVIETAYFALYKGSTLVESTENFKIKVWENFESGNAGPSKDYISEVDKMIAEGNAAIDEMEVEFDDMVATWQGLGFRVLKAGEYNPTTLVPTIAGAPNMSYLVPVPAPGSNDLYTEWIWINNAWERRDSEGRISLSENDDLDTYTKPGAYRASTSALVGTLSNCPYNLPFTMDVTAPSGATSTSYRAQQFLYPGNTVGFYYARHLNSAGVWGDWVQCEASAYRSDGGAYWQLCNAPSGAINGFLKTPNSGLIPAENHTGSLGTSSLRYAAAFFDALTLTNPLAQASGGTGLSMPGARVGNPTTAPGANNWYKAASIVMPTSTADREITFAVAGKYSTGAETSFGILKAHVRCGTSTISNAGLTWEVAAEGINPADFVLAISPSSPFIVELWVNIPGQYWTYMLVPLIQKTNAAFATTDEQKWTFYDRSGMGDAAPTAGYSLTTSTAAKIINPASQGVTLYSNASGTNGTVTLSESVSRFSRGRMRIGPSATTSIWVDIPFTPTNFEVSHVSASSVLSSVRSCRYTVTSLTIMPSTSNFARVNTTSANAVTFANVNELLIFEVEGIV